MQIVPTRLHGLLDYLLSMLVIALPFVAGWHGVARWSFIALGGLGIAYSLMTDYEWGVVRVLPMPLHLALDAIFGAAMVVLAAVLDLRGYVWLVVAIGILAWVLVLITERRPGSPTPEIRGRAP